MKKYENIYNTRVSAFINDSPQKFLFGIKDGEPFFTDFEELEINESVLNLKGNKTNILDDLEDVILIKAINNRRSVTLKARRNEKGEFEIIEIEDKLGEDLTRALEADRIIYLFRHGQTDYNIKGLTQGAEADEPLNEVGIKQALDLAHLFEGKSVHFFSSPQIRARSTGENLLKDAILLTNEDDDRFSEIHVGRFNGEPLLHAPLSVFYFPILPETEDPNKLYRRVDEAIRDIGSNYDGDSVVVSHGCALGNWIFRETGNPDLVLDKNLDCIVVDAKSGDILSVGPDEKTLQAIVNRHDF